MNFEYLKKEMMLWIRYREVGPRRDTLKRDIPML